MRTLILVHFVLMVLPQSLRPATCAASENWADPHLSTVDGLELWLDAGRLNGHKSLLEEGRIGEWKDASGKARHLKQDDASGQPSLVKIGPKAIVRFDGVDDCLRASNLGANLRSFTLVMVTAPRSNTGSFRGHLALNAANEKDYTSGVTVDLGPSATARFSVLNVEGRGFVGPQNLRTKESPFGKLHTLVITSEANEKDVRLTIDGRREGQRPRGDEPISLDEITLGARYYNNTIGPQHVDGFSRSDIAEVLLYSRVLTAADIESVEQYLEEKYASVKDALPSDSDGLGEPLQAIDNPPQIQAFVPGFSVRQLPLELSNINNVKYRSDGKLVALGYDGRIWLLQDTNGDGLEDKADLFWDNSSGVRAPIGMDLTPPKYVHGDGVFVVGKTRCVLIVDTDGDNHADKEIEIASGWKESFHQVDGLGVAFDPQDGSVYYGRGTYNFADPLLRDKDGKPQYDLKNESGAIIRVSPDFKTRQIIATGIRFPVAIRFNDRGDLFATDQEGATWVPNGNPLDELLHIQKGRHYGFPARHPLYLPNVIDEPSALDYGPQHQSLCGFNFNQPVWPDGPIFGPAWDGDAFVAGYSRGKLYRTQLVASSAGYVAKTQIFACLKMLTVDTCISPQGDLIVACHSGGPDWGSGPTGTGKLFKIKYVERDRPQPVFAWAASPQELAWNLIGPLIRGLGEVC